MTLYAAIAELRFADKADRDRAVEAIKKLRSKLRMSRLTTHTCTHDKQPFEPCTNQEEIKI
jgi:hypothetical protein